MIVADTSALASILLREEDAGRYEDALDAAGRVIIGAPTAFELRVAMVRKRDRAIIPAIDRMLADPVFQIVPFLPEHVALAQDALVRFGGRPARLNYGDCMAYALARAMDLPLLYKGGDFARTDVRSAL